MKRVIVLALAASAVVASSTLAISVASASSSSSSSTAALPTLRIALHGTSGIRVSGSTVSGAVKVVSSFTGKLPKGPDSSPAYGLVRLDGGVTLQQAFQAVQSHHGDLNALTPYARLLVSTGAPGTIETVLSPGNYVALNLSGQGEPGAEQFTISKSSSPAALPAAKATESAIEFGFRGAKVLHDRTLVRARNRGFLVHMITMIGVRNRAVGRKVISLLRAGEQRKAQKLVSHTRFVSLLDPASPGAMQQMVLRAKPGYYVEACFMDTQDGREHVRVGMERLVRVVR